MKKSIILSLCALVALACTKEVAPIDGANGDVIVVPATITASIDATKVTLDGLDFSWDEGDQIRLRTSTVNYTDNCDLFTAEKDGEGNVAFKGNLSYSHGQNIFFFASRAGLFPASSSSSQFEYFWYDEQSGRKSDLSLYSLFYGTLTCKDPKEGTPIDPDPVKTNSDGTYSFSAPLKPLFCLLKMNIKEGLGVAKIVISSESILGSTDMYVWGSRKPEQGFFTSGTVFARDADGSVDASFKEITVHRDGDEVYGDVYVSICPNAADANGEAINNSAALTFTFYDEDDNKLGELTRNLTSPLTCNKIKDLGNLTGFNFKTPVEPDPTEFEPKLAFSTDDPTQQMFVQQYVASAHPFFLEKGAKFYYTTGTTGIDDVATPTTSSPEIPSTGIPANPENAYELQYVKVLATCPGFDDVYIKAAIRSWRFAEGKTLVSNVEQDLTMPEFEVYGVTARNKTATTKFDVYTHSIMGGDVTQFVKMNNSSYGAIFDLYVGDTKTGTVTCAANQYAVASPGYFVSNINATAAVGTKLQISYKSDGSSRKVYIWNYAIIEQQTYTPSVSAVAAAGIDALTNGGQYNF